MKEGSSRRVVAPNTLEILQENLPEGLSKEKNYNHESELLGNLEKLDLTDLQIVLNEEGYAIWREMPSYIHNGAVDTILNLFQVWKQEQGAQLFGKQEADVLVSSATNTKRCPDYAIYGPDRLTALGNVRGVAALHAVMNPHVIFQFSCGDKFRTEKRAVDDISLLAGVGDYHDLKRPSVVYLIKARREGDASDSSVFGFDVYEVRPGNTTPDNPTMTYDVGGNEDSHIVVTRPDMGL
jgi:hypothetical protein